MNENEFMIGEPIPEPLILKISFSQDKIIFIFKKKLGNNHLAWAGSHNGDFVSIR